MQSPQAAEQEGVVMPLPTAAAAEASKNDDDPTTSSVADHRSTTSTAAVPVSPDADASDEASSSAPTTASSNGQENLTAAPSPSSSPARGLFSTSTSLSEPEEGELAVAVAVAAATNVPEEYRWLMIGSSKEKEEAAGKLLPRIVWAHQPGTKHDELAVIDTTTSTSSGVPYLDADDDNDNNEWWVVDVRWVATGFRDTVRCADCRRMDGDDEDSSVNVTIPAGGRRPMRRRNHQPPANRSSSSAAAAVLPEKKKKTSKKSPPSKGGNTSTTTVQSKQKRQAPQEQSASTSSFVDNKRKFASSSGHSDDIIDKDDDDTTLYEIERIVEIRKRAGSGRRECLVQWKGYTERTWEPYENFEFVAVDGEKEDGLVSDDDEEFSIEPPRKKAHAVINSGSESVSEDDGTTEKDANMDDEDVNDGDKKMPAIDASGKEGTEEAAAAPEKSPWPVYIDPKVQDYVESLPSDVHRERFHMTRAAFKDRPDMNMDELFNAMVDVGPPHFGLQAVQTKLDVYEERRGGWKPTAEKFQPEIGMVMRNMFEGEYFEGRIILGPDDVFEDDGTVAVNWTVRWQDGDMADYKIEQLYEMWPGCTREPTPAEGRQLAALELFCGRGIVTQHFWKLGFKVQSIDNDDLSNATLKADILSVEPQDLKFVSDFIWASPPCQTYSFMAAGKHRNKEEHEKSPEARQHNYYFAQMAKHLRFTLARHPHAIFLIENPAGLMEHMPLMASLVKELHLYKVKVDYCMFDRSEKKPTHLWTNDLGLHARLSRFKCTHPPGSHECVRSNAHIYDYSSIPEQLASLVASYVYSKLTLDGVRDWPAKKPTE